MPVNIFEEIPLKYFHLKRDFNEMVEARQTSYFLWKKVFFENQEIRKGKNSERSQEMRPL